MHDAVARRSFRTPVRTPVTTAAVLLAAAACTDVSTPAGPSTRPAASEQPMLARAGEVAGQPIPGQYIVIFRDAVGDVDAATTAKLERRARRKAVRAEARQARQLFRNTVRGFVAADLDDDDVAELRADPDVAYVEQDQIVTIDATQTNATWGIDRTDQRALPLNGMYTYNASGSGVRVYVIDSGIRTGHQEFGGRASNVYDGVGGNGQDCNGHGTHVAGTVGGSTYGVAQGALLRGVRVFSCSGGSANSTIIAAIDWVAANHIKPAVANLSLGGGFSQASNDAVARLSNAGVFVAVAAGNDNADACGQSPASAPAVTTVASSTRTDAKSSFSNYGSCVDLYAPGSAITAAWYTSNAATNTISGTSMASPHVAGVAALYKAARGDASQATIDSWLKGNATANVITGNPGGTPNRLLYKAGL